VQAFADVEHQIPARALGQSLHQLLRPADPRQRVAARGQHRFDRRDRFDPVEFRRGLGIQALGSPVVGEVVAEPDMHGSD